MHNGLQPRSAEQPARLAAYGRGDATYNGRHHERRAPRWSSTTGRSRAARARSSATTWWARRASGRSTTAARWDLEALLASRRTRTRPRRARARRVARGPGAPAARRAAPTGRRQRARALADDGRRGRRDRPAAGAVRRPAVRALQGAGRAARSPRGCEARRGRPVVPVFWVAADDHDFAEVRSVTVLDERGQLRTLRYAPRARARRPAGLARSCSTRAIAALVEELRARAARRACTATRVVERVARVLPPRRHARRRLRPPPLRAASPTWSSSTPPIPRSRR